MAKFDALNIRRVFKEHYFGWMKHEQYELNGESEKCSAMFKAYGYVRTFSKFILYVKLCWDFNNYKIIVINPH